MLIGDLLLIGWLVQHAVLFAFFATYFLVRKAMP